LIAERNKGHLYTGYSIAYNNRTGVEGMYPSYKVQAYWTIVDFDIFDE
jgi:hypothetical protein